MTLRSCSARAERPGSGNWTMSWWTTTWGAATLRIRPSSSLRRSASTNVMRSASGAGGRRLSRPTTCSTAGSAASRAATRAPSGPDTPVIRTRRVGSTEALRRSGAGRLAAGGGLLRRGRGLELGDARLEGVDPGAQRVELLGRGRPQPLDGLADAAGDRGGLVAERLAQAVGDADQLVGELLGALLHRPGALRRGAEGAFHGGAQLVGAGPAGTSGIGLLGHRQRF